MSSDNNGGPAFPILGLSGLPNGEFLYPEPGMTLRDCFALTALSAVPMPQGHMHDTPAAYDRIASHCYKMADAMLRAREGDHA